ncbi:hypothetical protein MLC59_02115 [Marinobacter bryozoorum]|uniref:hypothetical protein n=1 Tax=Marinobacter bryozoorum TaxID=256324 RepID=UPI002003DB82|nr:hypothetical protein [Marinobacter bryozoorum]MCK7542965.1 hypothetical protein [Marinobacter bryozoorum]
MKVHFRRSNLPGALLVQAALFSRWSHVAIEIGDTVYDATMSRGVQSWPAAGYTDRYSETETVELPGDETAARDFLRRQLGKKYDWMALVALPFRTTWQSPHRWFCSELVAKALSHAGVLSLPYKAWRVTPRDLHLVLRSLYHPRTTT